MTSTEPTGAIIPARSRRQAMDWSLVLLSQGIECIIEHLDDGWALRVGLVVLGLAMARDGAGCALLAAYLAGAGGNFARAVLHLEDPSLGASGMVMGGLGLLAIQSLSLRNSNPAAGKYIVGGILGGFMLFVLVGLDPHSDVIAHLGGFVCGLIQGGGLTLVSQKTLLRPAVNVLTGTALAALILLSWTLACRDLLRSQ